jgi:hypothetical protein
MPARSAIRLLPVGLRSPSPINAEMACLDDPRCECLFRASRAPVNARRDEGFGHRGPSPTSQPKRPVAEKRDMRRPVPSNVH